MVHFHFSVAQEVQVKGEVRNGNRDPKEHVPYPISSVHILNRRKRLSHLVNKYVLFPYFALKRPSCLLRKHILPYLCLQKLYLQKSRGAGI